MIEKELLNKWVERELETVRKFAEWYEGMHNRDPNDYPLQLFAGDWDEQFSLYCDNINESNLSETGQY